MTEPGPRVVSLVPSITETLLGWGVEPLACTRFCEQPDLEHVGGTKNPDLDRIVELAPDVVLFCDEENRREDFDSLVGAGVRCVSVAIESVDDVEAALRTVAGAIGFGDAPTEAIPEAEPAARISAFVPIWRRPWMTIAAGTYGASLLRRIGVANVFDDAAERYPETTLEEAGGRQPDVVLVPSEPYAFKPAHLEELAQVAPVVPVDGQDLFWWGHRTPAALRRLRDALGDIADVPGRTQRDRRT